MSRPAEPPDPPGGGERWRRRAEAIARGQPAAADPAPPSEATQRLVHELQVHQIELEMQNEELRRAQTALEESHTRYFELYDLAPVGYLTLSEAGLILAVNLKAADLLGRARHDLLQQPFAGFVHPEDQDRYHLARRRFLRAPDPLEVELRLLRPQGQAGWVRLDANRVLEGGAERWRVTLSDISERKQTEERLCQAAILFESTRDGVLVTDARRRILLVNRAFCELTGYTEVELLGQTPRQLASGRQDAAFYTGLWAELNATGLWQGEIWNRRKNGEIFWQQLSIAAVADGKGHISHYVGIYSDISRIRDAAARLEYLAHHDPLTGLPNRLLFYARLRHGLDLARREGKWLAVLMLDLDRFKDVNDSFGHLAGDEVLQWVAGRLTAQLRGVDTVTRLGGDEFAVLLEDLSHPPDAALVADGIIQSLGEPRRLSSGAEVHCGASIGISLYPDHGETAEQLLQSADAAMYRAKAEGRRNFKYFSDDLTVAASQRMRLESLLRRALAEDQLTVHYQPQVEISSGRIVGVEALARWCHPTEGSIPPRQFIPVAEETGLITRVTERVLGLACAQAQGWFQAGLPALQLAVNVSAHEFRHGCLDRMLTEVLATTGFPPQRLELELTESALMEPQGEAVATLERLRALGIHLAIDDFGTGYSSLAYLRRLPLDVIKIDRGFIEDLAERQEDQDIAAAIILMGHSLHLRVVAEGVETPAQLKFLTNLGCDGYQGYLCSPALPAESLGALLRQAAAVQGPDIGPP